MTMPEGLHLNLTQGSPIPLAAQIHCAPGEVLALVGPSGSGKSTLLRSIAGLYRPSSGVIRCGEEVWFDSTRGINMPTAARRVGMVFQNFALFPHLSALENIAEAMLDYPKEERIERARSWLSRVHLAGLEKRLPRQLSGGQQQRVAVARALAREPKVLLLDEPFSAVDRGTRESLYNELAELREELNMPMLLVTHDLDEATLLADRMSILNVGKTLQTDTPDQLLAAPHSAEVAKLMGMRNVFSGRVIRHEATHSLVAWGEHELRVRLREDFIIGTEIYWAMPTSGVLLMPSRSRESEALDNEIPARIVTMLALGEQYRVTLRVGADRVTMNVPRHIAQRYALAEDHQLSVRLRGETVHLMPLEG
jgi:molybdate transport system ATP-binding protein